MEPRKDRTMGNRNGSGVRSQVQRFASLALIALASSAIVMAQSAPAPVQDASSNHAAQAAEKAPDPTPAQSPAVSSAVSPAQKKKDQLTADTAKLLELANALKAEMDKSSKDTLSVAVIKKAEEVEKLAHKVRDEMKASLGN